jgi:hypothetical protein
MAQQKRAAVAYQKHANVRFSISFFFSVWTF